jgi:HK97 family phage major capsid protein
MTIKELREKAARAVAKASAIRDDSRPWTEKQAEFDAFVKEATDTQIEYQALEARETQLAQLSTLEGMFTRPASEAINPQRQQDEVGSNLQPHEMFALYVAKGRRDRFSEKNEIIVPGLNKEQVAVAVELHHEAFMAYLKGDVAGVQNFAARNKVSPKEVHALLSNDGTLGGFLVPEDWRAQVIKAEAGYTVLAPLCRIENTNSDALIFPKIKPHTSDSRRTSGFTGTWRNQGYVTGGTAPTVQNQPTFQRERIPVHDWQPDAVEVSMQLLEDSGANVEGIVADSIGECLAFDKDDAILAGTGVAQPEGVLNAGISTVNSGDADGIAYGGIIGLYTSVPAQYRQRSNWIMASRTLGAVIQLNTGTGGVYLFPPNQWNDTILNRPVKFLDYGMDTATAEGGTTFTAGEYPIIFGDFSRYIIAQRAALRVQRLVERFAPNIGILPTARMGGQVVLIDAFRIMTIAA